MSFGVAQAAWATLGTGSLTMATTEPVRRSYGYDISPARRVAVRLVRTDVKDTNQQALHDRQHRRCGGRPGVLAYHGVAGANAASIAD